MKQTLLRFFQGKNVKVSIFIQDGTQSSSGVIFLPMHETAPPGVKPPGRVVRYDNNGNIEKEYNCPIKLSTLYQPIKDSERVNIVTTELGGNIYIAEKRQGKSDIVDPLSQSDKVNEDRKTSNLFINSAISSNLSSMGNTNVVSDTIFNNSNVIDINNTKPNLNKINSSSTHSYLENTSLRKDNIEKVKKEFGCLADLLNTNVPKDDQIFKIDLFKMSGKRHNYQDNEDDDNDFIEIERENKLDKVKNMFEDFNISTQNVKNEDDDLLDLMDFAAGNK